nr:hypothetical protein [uncultured Rhodoferax sp.]
MPTPATSTPEPSRARRLLTKGIWSFMLLAPAVIAQPAMQSIANPNTLPLRNLQIEVRQVQSSQREQGGVQADAGLRLGSDGSVSAQARLRLGQQQEQQSGSASQQVLVLNGRSAAIALRSSTPFRLMQTQFRNGRPVLVQGFVLLEASTGFMATPRWDGTDQVELEISAGQSGRVASQSASTLVLPLGEWVSIAQSETNNRSARSGLMGQASEFEQQSSELQVRLTVR